MKKYFVKSLIVIMSIMLVLIGCSNKTDNSKVSDDVSEEITLTEPGTFPIVEEPVEMTILVRGDARVEDFATNAFTKWYEEKTNVKIYWEVAPEGSIEETLNLRLASGDFPDVIMNMGVTRAQEMIYGEQGVFLALNDLIDSQGYYMKDMFEANPEYKETITAPDGNIYSVPEVNECYHCSLAVKMWMYQPWLDKLGIDTPQTTDEFYQALKAFKEQDPNGNGQPDEIPLAGAENSWNSQVWLFLMNSFVNTPPDRLYLDNGKVTASFMQPGWKEGLQYLNKLYSEGLLAAESFTQDEQQFRQLGENPGTPILGAAPAGHQGIFSQIGGDSGRWLEYQTIPPLEGPSGLRQSVSFPYQVGTGKFVITSAAKYPEVAFRWADGLFNEEHTRRMNTGVPGEDWEEAEEGVLGIDGSPAKVNVLTAYGNVQNNQWFQAGPSWMSNEYRFSEAATNPEENLEVILYNQSNENYEPYRADIETVIPPLFFTEEQSTELADLQKTISDYVDEMLARFITGDANIDAEWDSYLQVLNDMNIERYLQIYQEAYDSGE